MRLPPLTTLAAGLLSALAGGALFAAAGLPLGWILGAMAGSAVFTNVTGSSAKTRDTRRTGQLLLGTATAGVLTPEILDALYALLPAMLAAAIAANLFGLALAWPLAKISGTDRITALLSSLPAGMAEMASLASAHGARTEVVTTVHTLRVVLVVLCVPLLLEPAIPEPATAPHSGGSWVALIACLVTGGALALVSSRIGLLNPFIIMPMAVGAALVAFGAQVAAMPRPLLVAAQVMIGYSLGARLRRQDFARVPRAVLAGIVCALALIFAMLFIVAPFLERWTDADIASLMLGVAPGGLGEMIASAKALGAASAIVAGFQFVRSFLTNMIVPQIIVRVATGGKAKGDADENR